MIPKIIHQTWKTDDLPENLLEIINNTKTLHKDWEYKFWTDNDCIELIKNKLPELYPLVQKCKNNGEKADIFRYAIIYLFGGFYFDLDFYFFKSIDSYFDPSKYNLCFFYESDEYSPFFYGKNNTIANCAFGAAPRNLFFKRVVDCLKDNICFELIKNTHFFHLKDPFLTLCKTGPIYLTFLHDISYDLLLNDTYYGQNNLYIDSLGKQENKVSVHACMNSWYN